MSLKKKLGLGIASAALGISLVGGGTFAYFNDTEESKNTFAAGTLDLDLNPEVIFDVSNIKPGDYMTRTFKMENDGSLDIKKVKLKTSYEVNDKKDDNGKGRDYKDFGDHIYVDFLDNEGDGKDYTVLEDIKLSDLSKYTEDDLAKTYEKERERRGHKGKSSLVDGIDAKEKDEIKVRIKFKDNGKDQNIFQGDKLELKWKFTAVQEDGEEVRNDKGNDRK